MLNITTNRLIWLEITAGNDTLTLFFLMLSFDPPENIRKPNISHPLISTHSVRFSDVFRGSKGYIGRKRVKYQKLVFLLSNFTCAYIFPRLLLYINWVVEESFCKRHHIENVKNVALIYFLSLIIKLMVKFKWTETRIMVYFLIII